MGEPHETPEFRNAVEYTVMVTVTVRGGARHGTADRRARRVAERLADAAARAADVVEVTATAGRSYDGEVTRAERVRFPVANTGSAAHGRPGKLDRYLDADHELALRSLAKANQAYRARERADRERRQAVSCLNTYSLRRNEHYCVCVYCAPGRHHDSVEALRRHPDNPFVERYCLCGQQVAAAGDRCARHRTATVVALSGDDPLLRRLAAGQHDLARDHPDGTDPPREQGRPPDRGLDR